MRILCFLLFVSGVSEYATSQVMWQIKTNGTTKWFLQFHDEFEGGKLDETKWKSGYPWGSAKINADTYFRYENLEVSEHTMKFHNKKENYKGKLFPWEVDSAYFKKIGKPASEEYDFTYTSGKISTHQTFKSGYFEIRFKTQKAYGMWHDFWLYGGHPNEEIDFFELKGERDNQIHVDVHCPYGCEEFRGGFLNLHKGWGGWVTAADNLSDGWNIVSGEWQKDFVKLFLNGTPIAYYKGEFKTAQNLIVGTGPAKTGGGFSPGPNETTPWPNIFEVDYVRVWSMQDTITRLKNQFREFEYTPVTVINEELYHSKLKKKLNLVYDKKQLSVEKGNITLLPVSYNKYSISIQGKELGKIHAEVIDATGKKAGEYDLDGKEYFIMDLVHLPAGTYTFKLTVLNQFLEHTLSVNQVTGGQR